jgi:Zn-dependent peptidase ImmA (M78 family)/DNA-binding XRE family transcriptional regulator
MESPDLEPDSEYRTGPALRMCDNPTMSGVSVPTQEELGRRIAEARADVGMTQADVAASAGLERTALVRIEAGERKVSATELVTLADILGRPVDWFFTESPPAVVSRRRDPAVGGFSRTLDLALELAARDVAFLARRRILATVEQATWRTPTTYEEAEDLARRIRAQASVPDGPLRDLQAMAEGLGLLGFSLALGPDAGDAAYVQAGNLGVAVVNGTADPGRRRFSLAHELGHHLAKDAYEPTPRLGAADPERMLNAFAAYLLMPRPAIQAVWNEFSPLSVRRAAIAAAVRFSVSWTAACNQLRNLDLIDSRERELLVENDLRRGELLESGERFTVELDPPSVPPAYASAVIEAYRHKRLTPARTVELLHDTIGEADLSDPDDTSLSELAELGPIPWTALRSTQRR